MIPFLASRKKPAKATVCASKAKPSPRRRKPQGEALMSTADLMRATGYGSPAISHLKSQGVIESTARGQWPSITTLGTLVRRLRERQDATGHEDRARKSKAEADSAELDALEKSGALVSLDAAKQFWSDSRIELRQLIERASYISAPLRARLLTEISKLKTKDIEE